MEKYINKFGNHDCQSSNYDERIRQTAQETGNFCRENYFTILDRVIELADIFPGAKVVDAGAGTGLLSERIAVQCEIVALDISRNMLAQAAAKNIYSEVLLGEFLSLPFSDGSVDRIISTFAFHHLTKPEKESSISEMRRVLSGNGKIVIGDFMFENMRQKKELFAILRDSDHAKVIEEIESEYYTDIAEIKLVFENYGFSLDYERGSTLSWIIAASDSKK